MLILGASATQEQIDAKTEELGLNNPVPLRYLQYMGNIFQGDLGESWMDGSSVLGNFIERFPNTLRLILYSIMLTVVVGIPLGVIAAVWQNRLIDKVTLVGALFFISVPAFFLGLMAQLLFALKLHWLPVAGADSFKHFIMPVVILSAAQIAGQVRMTRSSMLDVISQDYIRTAYAKGDNKFRVITYHALRNGLLPVVTAIGNSVAVLIAGTNIIEVVFAIPGIGAMMVSAVQARDVPLVMGPIIFISFIVCVINMLVDMIYAFIDPRIRLQYMKKGKKK
jgi:peptide/nickel transport system permease protein